MGLGYKLFKNHMLPLSALVFIPCVVGLLLTLSHKVTKDASGAVTGVSGLFPLYDNAIGEYNIWILVVSGFVGLVAGWYFVEQLYLRRKFARALAVGKKSDVFAARKDAEEIARQLPDSYRKKIDAALEGVAAPRSKRGA